MGVKTWMIIKKSVWVADHGNVSEVYPYLHTTHKEKPSSEYRRGFFILIPCGLSATIPRGSIRAVLRCRKTKKHSVRSENTHNPRSSNSLLRCTLRSNDDGFPVGHGSGPANLTNEWTADKGRNIFSGSLF